MATKTNSKLKNNNINSTESKDMFIYVLYLLLVLLPQYFKGGYFESSFIPYIFGISILMILYIRKNYKGTRNILINSETNLLLFLLTILYGITCFYGISKRGSIVEFIKYVSFLALFIITTDIHKTYQSRRRTMDLIILGGIVLCIIGIGTMVGTWEYTASYSGNRLSSTFQYPNTLAVYAASMYFLAMGQALISEDAKRTGLYGGAMFVFFSALIFTYSRGMWLIFPIILLGFFIVLAGNKKVELFFYTLGSLIVAIPVSFLFLKYVEDGGNILWGIYFAGIIASSIVLLLLGKTTQILAKISWKAIIAVVLVIGVAAGGALIMAIDATEPISYENNAEEAVLSRLTRNIKNVFPNTDYEINVSGTGKINSEEQYAGRVVVYSVNEQIKYTSLGTFDIVENGDFDLSIPITTLEDTNVLVVYFENRNVNTSVTYDEANITDLQTTVTEKIPLKYKYIPEAIVRRVAGINATDNSAQARIIFSKDAIKLALNGFLLGTGGQGWATSYRSIQSYPYWSKHVHNHYLQLFVETGILGIVLFGGFLAVLIYKYFKYKKDEEDVINKTLADSLLVAAGTILAHAAIDFDLSLVGLFIILWVLLGILNSIVSPEKNELKIFSLKVSNGLLKKLNSVVTALTVIALVFSASIYGGIFFTKRAVIAQEHGDNDGIESSMKRAVQFDPFNTTYKTDLIDVYFFQYQAKSDESYGNLAKSETDKLLKYGKHDPNAYITAAQSYFKFGLVEEGLNLIRQSLQMQPLVIESYSQNTDAHLSIFSYYMNQGDLESAKKTALEGYNFINDLLLESNVRSIRPMSKNNKMFFDLSRLKHYGEDFDDYISYLEKAYSLEYFYDFNLDVDNDNRIELVSMWNAQDGKLDYEIIDEGVRLNNSGANYGVFDSANFNLNPETTYLVAFDAKGDMTSDKVSFYILDTKAEEQLQTPSTPVELTNDWETYEIEFTTDSDVGENTSRYRFVIGGENEGQMDLRNVKIFEKLN
ncbi:MAG: O-antigen ligase family protein [Tissierellaceae bacterium]|nr:O-antigen ligase family protein [Tissierellaceae bacterium]